MLFVFFSRHTVCSITISIICFRNSKLPTWFFFFFSKCEREFPSVVWTISFLLLFHSDDLFSSFLPPSPTPIVSYLRLRITMLSVQLALGADPRKDLGREQRLAWLLPAARFSWVSWLRSLRCRAMTPTAGNAQNAEVTWPVAIGNATEVCGTKVLWDTDVCLNVAPAWTISRNAASSAFISFSQGQMMRMVCPFPPPQRAQQMSKFGSCSAFEMDKNAGFRGENKRAWEGQCDSETASLWDLSLTKVFVDFC